MITCCRSFVSSRCWFTLLALLVLGCRTPATQVQLFLDTDSPVDRAITIEVFSFNGSVAPTSLLSRANAVVQGSLRLLRVNQPSDTFIAGGSIGVVPPSDRTNNTVTLWIRATVAATATSPAVLLDRAARVSFVRGRTGTARVFLPLRCGDSSVGCSSVGAAQCTVSVRCREQNATCGDLGECVPVEIPVVILGGDGGVLDAPTEPIDASAYRPDSVSTAVDVPTDEADGVAGMDVTARTDVAADVPVVIEDTGVCAIGLELFNGRCIRAGLAPRPIAPVSLGDVTLRSPTLRWQLPVEFAGARVELCRDRACTQVIETIDAVGTSARPAAELPSNSVVFWRLRGMTLGATAATVSPTWLFHVPPAGNLGGIDTSYNAHLDMNGDGFDDVVVGAQNADPGGRQSAGVVYVFHGSALGITALANTTLGGVAVGDRFGHSVAGAGDLNGDGFGDLVVGAYLADPAGIVDAGTVSVFHGSRDGTAITPVRVFAGVALNDRFGYSVAGAGDVDRDGFADLVIGSVLADPGARPNAGIALVFQGTETGVGMDPSRTYEGLAGYDHFGSSVASAGDVNGDGFGDLLIGAESASPVGRPDPGTASVYLGSAGGLAMNAANTIEGVGLGDLFGFSAASAGDVNGDGFSDLIIGAVWADPGGRTDAGTATVFHGSINGVVAAPARVFEGENAADNFGWSVASAGDLNGDGFSDVVIGAPLAAPGGRATAGTVRVVHGSPLGLAMISARVFAAAPMGDNFGWSVAGAGDINGDGFGDLLIGAYRATTMALGTRTGSVSVFHGSPGGVPLVSTILLPGLATSDQFGFSVASLFVGGSRTGGALALEFAHNALPGCRAQNSGVCDTARRSARERASSSSDSVNQRNSWCSRSLK